MRNDEMPFRLFYRGPLKSNGSKEDKHSVRLTLHPQIEKLWNEEPLSHHQDYLTKQTDPNKIDLLYPLGMHTFACLVSERLKLYAELDILFLRPQPPGQIVSAGGDIDNRLKTLFDGLRRPLDASELPTGSALSSIPNPCHCLLSEDALITRVSVTTDNLLDAHSKDEVVLIITTTVKKICVMFGNMSYIE
jgi:hypothetical protein